mgnify:CR=1 FL=1
MTDEKKITAVTEQLLIETDKLKKSIKESMMVGEVAIIKGIIFFEVIVKEVNPEVLTDEEINKIKNYTMIVLKSKEEEIQKVSNHMHYGVNRCFLMLDGYNRRIKKYIKK